MQQRAKHKVVRIRTAKDKIRLQQQCHFRMPNLVRITIRHSNLKRLERLLTKEFDKCFFHTLMLTQRWSEGQLVRERAGKTHHETTEE